MKKYYIVCATLLILTTGCFETKKSDTKTNTSSSDVVEKIETNNYVAYLNFGPSLKLNYERVCNVKGTDSTCSNPTVNSVELVNESAKAVFTNIDLIGTNKELDAVLNNIYTVSESKGTKVDNVVIQSDWDGLNNYIISSSNSNSTYKKVSTTVSKVTKEQITTNISSDLTKEKTDAEAKAKAEAEAKAKAEADAKAEAEAKAKAEAEAKKKAEAEAKKKAEEEAKKKAEAEKKAQTIYLKDKVQISTNLYLCECKDGKNCLSNSFIKSVKGLKGNKVSLDKENPNKVLHVAIITGLSGKYNTAIYKGTSALKKIESQGASCDQRGGSIFDPNNLVDKATCKEFNLICE